MIEEGKLWVMGINFEERSLKWFQWENDWWTFKDV